MQVKENNFAIVVSAPSGAGKSTIIRQVMAQDDRITFSVSTTTRQKREGEVDGVNYHFVSVHDFEKMIEHDEFLEWAKVHTGYYGTSKKEVDRILTAGKIPLFDIDVQGAKNIRSYLHGGVFIFIIPPSLVTLSERLRRRNTETEEQLQVRLKNAAQEVREAEHYDYIVVNDRLDYAIADVRSILRAETLKRGRMLEKIDIITNGGHL
jgi:guanylate kinase